MSNNVLRFSVPRLLVRGSTVVFWLALVGSICGLPMPSGVPYGLQSGVALADDYIAAGGLSRWLRGDNIGLESFEVADANGYPDEFLKEEPREYSGGGGAGFLHGLIMYLPNRILDLTDIFRLRVKVGPGFGAGVRVTEGGSIYLGSYAALYAGLPGGNRSLPVGVESYNGIKLSFLDFTIDGPVGPEYGFWEVGLGAHLLLVGVDAGVDPMQLVDFITGLVCVDIADDDW